MPKHLLFGIVAVVLIAILACGSDPTATSAPRATTAPASTTVPASPSAPADLASYAAAHAGGPGAIYVGDLSQLVGPAPTSELGDIDTGNVPLESLERHLWIYESDYYKSLLERANLANPTPLVSTGEDFTIQYACINRSLAWCKLANEYMFPNVLARTNGQLKLESSSFPELGISGTDGLTLITDGTLAMLNVNVFVAGALPAIEITEMYGMYPSREAQFKAVTAIAPDIEKMLVGATEGAKFINYGWVPGLDIYFFTNKPLRTVADFEGMRTRAFGPAIGDWIIGMGADAQFVTFAEVYTALERGILDAGVTGAEPGHGQRWYEITDYINGSLPAFTLTTNMVNKKVWEELPPDLQAIMIEEGAKDELESLRIAAILNETGLEKNIRDGMEYVEFSQEVRARSDAAVFESMVPNWVKRVGGGDVPFITEVFNPKIGPLVGLRVEPDGSVVKIPIVK